MLKNGNVYTISQLTENEWRQFSQIRLKALRTDPLVFGSNYQKESLYSEDEWRNLLRGENSAIFMIYENGKPVGITGIAVDRNDPTYKTAIMWGSWLKPEVRRKGLSEMMYEARINWAKEHSMVEKIVVSHRAANLSSKAANQKHGFSFKRTVPKVWMDGVTEEEVFYELKIK
jgi:RimJ/RimL family protein N-acetyltransferase